MTSVPASPRRRGRDIAFVIAGATLVVWALASGYYIFFHDRMLANLLSRQAEMQYAYEDRIAELRGALEGANTQSLHDSLARDTTLRDLAARGARLEVQIASLAALIGDDHSGDLRACAAAGPGRRVDLGPSDLTASFTALEGRQRGVADTLRERTEHADARTQAALAELGLAPPAATVAAGGPFVPLPASTGTAADAVVRLRDALDWHRRLDAVATRLPLRQPVDGPLDVTSGFGARRDPFYGRLALHTGIDLREDFGSAVRAVAAGTVTIAGPESGYGTLVEIDHGNGYATRYAHLSTMAVTTGQRVGAGVTIGQVGTTGRSTGPHLHYEVRIAGEPIDPARYLALATMIAGE